MRELVVMWLGLLCMPCLMAADIVLDPSYGVFVPGEKVEIQLDSSTIGCSVRGLPSGLKFAKATGVVTGAAKKGPQECDVKFTKKVAGGSVSATALFRVAPMPAVSVAVVGAEGVKVNGTRAYCAGKKVSLSVKVPRGFVFLGWTQDGFPFPDEATCLEPKQKFAMPGTDLDLIANFREEQVSVACDLPSSCGLKQALNIPVTVACESAIKSVQVKGLPSGLKYDRKSKAITGAAKKTGNFDVRIIVRTKAESAVEWTSRLVVEDESSSEIGKYAGTYSGNTTTVYSWGEEEPGMLELTINRNGTISGAYTMTRDGSRTPFSGSVDRIDAEGCLIAGVRATVDGHKVDFLVEAMPDGRAWFSGTISGEERIYSDVLRMSSK